MTTLLDPTPSLVEPGERPDRRAAALRATGRWAAAIGGALVIFSALLLLRGANPLEALGDMWVSTFLRGRSLAEILNVLAPITLAALAVLVPARAGLTNVGGEGQLMLGAIAAGGTALALDQQLPGPLVLVLALVAGGVAGAAWAGVAAILRLRFQVDEAVSTLLLNFIALDLLLFLIYQPWRESAAGQPTTRELADAAKMPVITGTVINVGIIVALAATVVVILVLGRTRWGFRLSVVGGNAEAARRAGMNVAGLVISALIVGGLLAGLAGAIQFTGIEYKLRAGFGLQIGYLGVLASWLARHRPLPVLLASFVLAALAIAGDSLQLDAQLPAASVNILTALILAAVLGWTTVKARRA
jgi:simple sugar transport system permease protein